jgi:hypothetical protein
MPDRLKEVLFRCLGAESERPALHELVTVLKELMRERAKERLSIPLAERSINARPSHHVHAHLHPHHHVKAYDSKIH